MNIVFEENLVVGNYYMYASISDGVMYKFISHDITHNTYEARTREVVSFRYIPHDRWIEVKVFKFGK